MAGERFESNGIRQPAVMPVYKMHLSSALQKVTTYWRAKRGHHFDRHWKPATMAGMITFESYFTP